MPKKDDDVVELTDEQKAAAEAAAAADAAATYESAGVDPDAQAEALAGEAGDEVANSPIAERVAAAAAANATEVPVPDPKESVGAVPFGLGADPSNNGFIAAQAEREREAAEADDA